MIFARRRSLFLALVVSLLAASFAPAKPPGLSGATALRSSLQRVARELFAVGVGELVRVRRVGSEQAAEAGANLEKYEVAKRDGTVMGHFVRVAVPEDEGTRIDLALRFDEGRIAGVAPLSPVVVRGKAFLELPAYLRGLSHVPVDGYAPELASVCQALAPLVRSSAGADGGPIFTPEQEINLRAAIKTKTPSLSPGTPLPAFAATVVSGQPAPSHQESRTGDDGWPANRGYPSPERSAASMAPLAGQSLTPARFTGERGLILVTMVQARMTRRVTEWLRRYDAEHAGRFEVATIFVNDEAEIEQYRVRGGELAGTVAADPRGAAQDALRVTFMPAVVVTDRAARVWRVVESPFEGYEALSVTLDAME